MARSWFPFAKICGVFDSPHESESVNRRLVPEWIYAFSCSQQRKDVHSRPIRLWRVRSGGMLVGYRVFLRQGRAGRNVGGAHGALSLFICLPAVILFAAAARLHTP